MDAEVYTPPSGSIPTLEIPSLGGVHRIHMIGIGGAGMRNLAKLLLARGISVSGSDLKDSKGLRELQAAGARVSVGHGAEQVDHPDAVVISSAIGERNPELLAARQRGIPVWARAQLLAAAGEGHRVIAVAGTHGKTTTTSMLAMILERAGLEPTYVVGGDLNEIGSGARAGAGDLFVAEADESDGSFLLPRAAIGIVTNVEVDHVDFYTGGAREIEAAFASFMRRSEAVVACGDDPGVRAAAARAGRDVVTYGIGEDTDVRVVVETDGPGGARGTIAPAREEPVAIHLTVDGSH
ncbi:MAG: Mur ligase domain-containing protein, partial [Actinomycetota bacterium]|nr:Mur ligase domain-containing protein [Actinomycetota bacterium]